MSLNVGDQAPDLKLPSTKGKKVVVYFYPKDDTPGCTKEACEFRDLQEDFSEVNAVIVGISKDSEASHEKFIAKYGLPFELIADEELELIKAFGAWQEKSMYGRKYMGIQRSTYLLDEDGKVLQIWPKVKVRGHVAEVLKSLQSL